MPKKTSFTPATTYISIAVGVFMISYVAVNRSFSDFTFLTLIGYVGASLIGLIGAWLTVWVGVSLFGNTLRIENENPPWQGQAVLLAACSFIGALCFFGVLILFGL